MYSNAAGQAQKVYIFSVKIDSHSHQAQVWAIANACLKAVVALVAGVKEIYQ